MRKAPGSVTPQARAWHRVEEVGELAEADAPHLGEPARGEQEARERLVVGPRLPGLEVLADREWRAVAEVAHPERVPQAAVGLELGTCRGETSPDLRRSCSPSRRPGRCGRRTGSRAAGSSRSRASAAATARAARGGLRRSGSRTASALGTARSGCPRGTACGHRRSRSRPNWKLARPEEQRVELLELACPICGRPVVDATGAAEVTVEMRADLVAVAIAGHDAAQRSGHGEVPTGECESDRRLAALMSRRPVAQPMSPVNEIDAADEEREVRPRSARDRAPVRPHALAARAVERDDDELRWANWRRWRRFRWWRWFPRRRRRMGRDDDATCPRPVVWDADESKPGDAQVASAIEEEPPHRCEPAWRCLRSGSAPVQNVDCRAGRSS